MPLYRGEPAEARLNFRQGLTSNLHFRQGKLPNLEFGGGLVCETARIVLNLRQLIASHRGKEIVQVSIIAANIVGTSITRLSVSESS